MLTALKVHPKISGNGTESMLQCVSLRKWNATTADLKPPPEINCTFKTINLSISAEVLQMIRGLDVDDLLIVALWWFLSLIKSHYVINRLYSPAVISCHRQSEFWFLTLCDFFLKLFRLAQTSRVIMECTLFTVSFNILISLRWNTWTSKVCLRLQQRGLMSEAQRWTWAKRITLIRLEP